MRDAGNLDETVSGVRDGEAEGEWLAIRINTPRALTQRYVEELVFHVFYNGPLAGSKERIAKAFLALAAEDTSARNVPAREGSANASRAGTRAVAPIPGFDGYFASSDGVITGPNGQPLPLCAEYPRVLIQRPGEPRHSRRRYTVHSLVAAAFLGPRPEGHDVDHIDTDPRNPRPSNLRYRAVAKNRGRDGRTPFGPNHNANKTHCKRGHEFTAENTRIHGGKRYCRACKKDERARGLQNVGN